MCDQQLDILFGCVWTSIISSVTTIYWENIMIKQRIWGNLFSEKSRNPDGWICLNGHRNPDLTNKYGFWPNMWFWIKHVDLTHTKCGELVSKVRTWTDDFAKTWKRAGMLETLISNRHECWMCYKSGGSHSLWWFRTLFVFYPRNGMLMRIEWYLWDGLKPSTTVDGEFAIHVAR